MPRVFELWEQKLRAESNRVGRVSHLTFRKNMLSLEIGDGWISFCSKIDSFRGGQRQRDRQRV